MIVDDLLGAASEACASSSSMSPDALPRLQQHARALLDVEDDVVRAFVAPSNEEEEERGVTAMKLSHALRLHARYWICFLIALSDVCVFDFAVVVLTLQDTIAY